MSGTAYLLTLSCPNQPGIVARVTAELFAHDGDIGEAQQFDDGETDRFFMRIIFDLPNGRDIEALKTAFAPIAAHYRMDWSIRPRDERRKVLILASKSDHCLVDLLYRWRIGELLMDVVGIVSNHAREVYNASDFGAIPFHYLPITPETKPQQEAQIKAIVEQTGAELVVLARYMQILSDDMARYLSGRCINIHHSFLPSFKGAKPYYQAHDRGVKLIGATAHYVTADLDEGPIIEQDVARVDHSYSVEHLTALGRDTESMVLARAVKWHSEHRVLVNGHKTVIFK